MTEEYVQDFDGEKVDEKTILERKVMEGKELSVDDRLIIIRALEKAEDSVFNPNPNPNQNLTIVGKYNGWWDANKITYTHQVLNPQITCDTITNVSSTNEKDED